MIVAFETRGLREICEDDSVARKEFGPAIALHLRQRLADIRAATTIFDLPLGNPRTEGETGELLIIDLGSISQMTWVVNHPKPHHIEGGLIDWGRVSRVRLIRIGDA